jgi:hypothetical protein
MDVQELSLALLEEAPWNANRVSRSLLAKIRRSLTEFGVVENLVARPHPEQPGRFEVISGNHRLRLLHELNFDTAPVVVVELDDAHARLLAQTLTRTRGSDDPQAYAREQALAELDVSAVTGLLPETEATIDAVLRDFGTDQSSGEGMLPELPAVPSSKPGEIYQLGEHRLACGDATDPAMVAELMGGESAVLLATDPPYGIRLDHGWRDGVRQLSGSARAGELLNDDRADWRDAYILVSTPVPFAAHSLTTTSGA